MNDALRYLNLAVGCIMVYLSMTEHEPHMQGIRAAIAMLNFGAFVSLTVRGAQ